jgi:hypothetical protein
MPFAFIGLELSNQRPDRWSAGRHGSISGFKAMMIMPLVLVVQENGRGAAFFCHRVPPRRLEPDSILDSFCIMSA